MTNNDARHWNGAITDTDDRYPLPRKASDKGRRIERGQLGTMNEVSWNGMICAVRMAHTQSGVRVRAQSFGVDETYHAACQFALARHASFDGFSNGKTFLYAWVNDKA